MTPSQQLFRQEDGSCPFEPGKVPFFNMLLKKAGTQAPNRLSFLSLRTSNVTPSSTPQTYILHYDELPNH